MFADTCTFHGTYMSAILLLRYGTILYSNPYSIKAFHTLGHHYWYRTYPRDCRCRRVLLLYEAISAYASSDDDAAVLGRHIGHSLLYTSFGMMRL